MSVRVPTGTDLRSAAGAKLYPVHSTLAAHGRTIPTGTCPTVGAAGLTLGGGLGIASRQYGLTCDQLFSARIVTADGVDPDGEATTNRNLLWALRGGGGGNFGIVTLLEYHTQPTTSLGFFLLSFPWANAAAVVRGWSSRIQVMPHTTWANLHLEANSNGDLRGAHRRRLRTRLRDGGGACDGGGDRRRRDEHSALHEDLPRRHPVPRRGHDLAAAGLGRLAATSCRR